MTSSSSPGEDEAISRFLASPDSGSYAVVFPLLASRVMRYLRVRGCDVTLAEDLTQDVMFAVYRENTRLRDKNLFLPWLYRIARNALLQHRRKAGSGAARQTQADLEYMAGDTPNPLAGAEFSQWMEALNPDEREAITLRYVEDLKYHEIAAMLEIPAGTVQWRVFQSKKKLAARVAAAGR
jgi:RNA polymerase sigma-70 factor (ECF subfamily)